MEELIYTHCHVITSQKLGRCAVQKATALWHTVKLCIERAKGFYICGHVPRVSLLWYYMQNGAVFQSVKLKWMAPHLFHTHSIIKHGSTIFDTLLPKLHFRTERLVIRQQSKPLIR